MQAIRQNRSAVSLAMAVLLAAALCISTHSHAQTLQRIRESGAINIGFVPDQAPFSFLSADSKPAGYAVELCRNVSDALKARAGLSALNVNYIPANSATGLRMVEEGKIDLLCGPITATLRARERVSFSIPVYFTGIGALVHTDAPPALLRVLNGQAARTGPNWRGTVNAGLANYTYAIYTGTVSEDWVRERVLALGVIAKVVIVNTYSQGIEMVMQRKADAFFADRAALATNVARRSGGDADLLVLDRRFTIEPVALAVPRGDEDFRLAVDTALSKLYRSGDYVRAYLPAFGEPSDSARMLFQAYSLP